MTDKPRTRPLHQCLLTEIVAALTELRELKRSFEPKDCGKLNIDEIRDYITKKSKISMCEGKLRASLDSFRTATFTPSILKEVKVTLWDFWRSYHEELIADTLCVLEKR